MSTCNWLDLQTWGSQLVMPKNLPDHWWSVLLLKSWTSTGYFSNSTGSSVTNCRFSPIIGVYPPHKITLLGNTARNKENRQRLVYSYRWSGWVSEKTGWRSPRLQETYWSMKGFYKTLYLWLIKKNWKITTLNRLDLGIWLIVLKNLPNIENMGLEHTSHLKWAGHQDTTPQFTSVKSCLWYVQVVYITHVSKYRY